MSTHEARSRRRKKKTAARVVTCAVLLAVIAAAAWGALYFTRQTRVLREENEQRLADAQSRLAAAQADYDAIDPGTVEGAERQLAAEQEILAEAQREAEAIRSELDTLSGELAAAEEQVAALEADEDTQYFLTVYSAYQDGMEKVEGYIEGN